MPFKSKAQQRFMFAAEERGDVPEGTAKRWAHHTKNIKKLPEHKHKSKHEKKAAFIEAFVNSFYHKHEMSKEAIAKSPIFELILDIADIDFVKAAGDLQFTPEEQAELDISAPIWKQMYDKVDAGVPLTPMDKHLYREHGLIIRKHKAAASARAEAAKRAAEAARNTPTPGPAPVPGKPSPAPAPGAGPAPGPVPTSTGPEAAVEETVVGHHVVLPDGSTVTLPGGPEGGSAAASGAESAVEEAAEHGGEKGHVIQNLATSVGVPFLSGSLGGAGLARLLSPSQHDIGNLQKEELLVQYDNAIREMRRRMSTRQQ